MGRPATNSSPGRRVICQLSAAPGVLQGSGFEACSLEIHTVKIYKNLNATEGVERLTLAYGSGTTETPDKPQDFCWIGPKLRKSKRAELLENQLVDF